MKRKVNSDKSILSQIGNTPLLRIANLTNNLNNKVEIYIKAEWYNPGGSVKDRPALWMIEDAEQKGLLTPDKTIIEATSGNTGVALALIGRLKGYKVKLVVPKSTCVAKLRRMEALGAELILTEAALGTDGAILEAHRILNEAPEKYFMPNQYDNPANLLSHYETTGPEIIEQTEGKVTHLVVGLGTSGTAMGAGSRLKEYNDKIKVIGVQPDEPFPGIEGLKHMETAILPKIYDEGMLDAKISANPWVALEFVKKLAKEEGLFVGHSSGAVMYACLKVAKELKEGVIVGIFADNYDICDKFIDIKSK